MLLDTRGYEIHRNFVSEPMLVELAEDISKQVAVPVSGIRNADVQIHSIARLAKDEALLNLAQGYIGPKPRLIRAIYFNKTPSKNWLVPWHQDKTIAIQKKVDLAGWGPWSIKEGVHHVHPPLDILEKMVSFRIHLDKTDDQNACLKVVAGTHRSIMTDSEIKILTKSEVVNCHTERGDLLALKPLILHSSSKSASPENRRVIHLEFGNFELPEGVS